MDDSINKLFVESMYFEKMGKILLSKSPKNMTNQGGLDGVHSCSQDLLPDALAKLKQPVIENNL